MADEPDLGTDVSEDALLDGRVRLRQPRRGHRAGTDAVLLAALSDARPGDTVVDLGSASGAVGLMIAARIDIGRILFLDRDPALVELARENIGLNGLEKRAEAVVADAFATCDWPAAGIAAGAADLVVTNPPFFDRAARPSPDPGRRAAHVMEGGGLTEWLVGAGRLLKPNGRMILIQRADRWPECLDAMRAGFGSLSISPVYPRAGTDASRIVIAARRGGRSAPRILPPVILHEADGQFTVQARQLHGQR